MKKLFILAALLWINPVIADRPLDPSPEVPKGKSWRSTIIVEDHFEDDVAYYYIIDPKGNLWYWTCKTTPSGQTHCQFKKAK